MVKFDDLIKETTVNISERPSNYIAFIVDHSGSMSDVSERSRTNFNEQLNQIKEDSKDQNNYVTLIEFDSLIKERYVNTPIDEIKELRTYWIGGMTALYDAIMLGISRVENSMPEEGNNAALITIITDGYENASRENSGEEGRLRVKKRIEELQAMDKWTFVFMGADQNVLETAVEDLGINVGNTFSYSNSDDDLRMSSERYKMSYTTYANSRRLGNTSSIDFFNDKEETQC